jgi:predicted dehydrogenase
MKVLVAGLGSMGQRHVRNLRALLGRDVEIVAYRVRKRTQVLTEALEVEAGSSVEEKYRLHTCDQLDQALALEPQAVFVCNPSRHHMAVALAAAQAGCHLLVEKPLSDRYDGIEELIARVEQQRLVALVGYQMRFHPALQRVRLLLEQGAIGRVLSVHAEIGEYLPSSHPYEDYRGTYAARADLGGGVVLSQSHELDYVYWLFGLPRRIFALGGHLSRLDVDVEDTARILMACIVDGRPVAVHVSQDFVQRPPRQTCRIVGDEGQIQLDLRAPTLEVFDSQGGLAERRTFSGFQRNQLFMDELTHFLACLRGEETPRVTLRDGAQSLRMALAVRQSIDTGQVVELQ